MRKKILQLATVNNYREKHQSYLLFIYLFFKFCLLTLSFSLVLVNYCSYYDALYPFLNLVPRDCLPCPRPLFDRSIVLK
jgi:hypothetical protein